MPVTAPALNEMSSPAASDFVAACAVRTFARTETFMPMKPAAPESSAPIRKPTATRLPSRNLRAMKTTAPTMAIVMYWRLRYACAPSAIAAAISCIFCVPASADITDWIAQIP